MQLNLIVSQFAPRNHFDGLYKVQFNQEYIEEAVTKSPSKKGLLTIFYHLILTTPVLVLRSKLFWALLTESWNMLRQVRLKLWFVRFHKPWVPAEKWCSGEGELPQGPLIRNELDADFWQPSIPPPSESFDMSITPKNQTSLPDPWNIIYYLVTCQPVNFNTLYCLQEKMVTLEVTLNTKIVWIVRTLYRVSQII